MIWQRMIQLGWWWGHQLSWVCLAYDKVTHNFLAVELYNLKTNSRSFCLPENSRTPMWKMRSGRLLEFLIRREMVSSVLQSWRRFVCLFVCFFVCLLASYLFVYLFSALFIYLVVICLLVCWMVCWSCWFLFVCLTMRTRVSSAFSSTKLAKVNVLPS